jgi:methylphosphotriester-DNA--protein-cysteine methyltransferase
MSCRYCRNLMIWEENNKVKVTTCHLDQHEVLLNDTCPEDTNPLYFASKKYKIVCKEGCSHIKNILGRNLLIYKSLEEAIKDGCRPCKHCLKGGYGQ